MPPPQPSTKAAIINLISNRYNEAGELRQSFIHQSQMLYARLISGKGNLVYSLAEDSLWKDFVSHLCPGMKYPNGKKAAQTLVPAYEKKLKVEVNKKLQEAGSGTICIDGSADGNKDPIEQKKWRGWISLMGTQYHEYIECLLKA
eukprot:106301_1